MVSIILSQGTSNVFDLPVTQIVIGFLTSKWSYVKDGWDLWLNASDEFIMYIKIKHTDHY